MTAPLSENHCVHRFDFVPMQGIVCTKCRAVATTETTPANHTAHHWVERARGAICDECGLIRSGGSPAHRTKEHCCECSNQRAAGVEYEDPDCECSCHLPIAQRTSNPICDCGEKEKLTRQINGYRDALGRAHARANRNADERDAAERKLGVAQDEIERLRAENEALQRRAESAEADWMALSQDDGKVERALERSEEECRRLRAALREVQQGNLVDPCQFARETLAMPADETSVMSDADVDRTYGAGAVKRAYYETHEPPHYPTCGCDPACTCGTLAGHTAECAVSVHKQAICKHLKSNGWGSIAADGTSYGEMWCMACGKKLVDNPGPSSKAGESHGE